MNTQWQQQQRLRQQRQQQEEARRRRQQSWRDLEKRRQQQRQREDQQRRLRQQQDQIRKRQQHQQQDQQRRKLQPLDLVLGHSASEERRVASEGTNQHKVGARYNGKSVNKTAIALSKRDGCLSRITGIVLIGSTIAGLLHQASTLF